MNETTGCVKSVIHDKCNNCSRFVVLRISFKKAGRELWSEWDIAGYPTCQVSPPDLHIYQAPWQVNQQTISLLPISFYSPLLYLRHLKFPIIFDGVSKRCGCCSNATDAAIRFSHHLTQKVLNFKHHNKYSISPSLSLSFFLARAIFTSSLNLIRAYTLSQSTRQTPTTYL